MKQCQYCGELLLDSCRVCIHCTAKNESQESALSSKVLSLALLLGLGNSGCVDGKIEPDVSLEYGVPIVDYDGDGYFEDDDCDEDDININPGADEIWYDGIDQNCDGQNDFDADGDGFVPDEYYDEESDLLGGDCNDNDATIHPEAEETAGDDFDSNCNEEDDT